jgi:hypothetical protein
MRAGDDDLSVLRSKYNDWVSARVADRFVDLTPEEIYELAHGSGAGGGGVSERGPEASASIDAGAFSFEEAGYTELVRRVTEALATSLELPVFELWVESYRREPERYDREMLGFWKSP